MTNTAGRSTSLSSLDDAEWQTATIESSEEWNSQQQIILASSIATRSSFGEYACLSIEDFSSDSENSFSSSVVSFIDDGDDSETDSSESEGHYYEPLHKKQQQLQQQQQQQQQQPNKHQNSRQQQRPSMTSIASLLGQQALAYISNSAHGFGSSRGFFTSITKSVSFDHRQNEIHEIPSNGDFSKEECNSIWYQRDDLKRVRKDNQRLVKLLDQGILFVDDDDMCYGLETEEDSQLRQRISESSVSRVCVEQERCINDEEYEDEKHGKIGNDDCDNDADTTKSSSREERLSTVYFESSFACQLEAHQRALQLERDIQDYVCPAPKCRWGADEGEMSSSSIGMASRRISDGTQQQGLPTPPTRRESFRSVNLDDIDVNHEDDSSSDGDEDESSSSCGDLSVATYMSDNSTIASQQDSIKTPTSPTSLSSSLSLSSSSSSGSSSSDSSSKGPPKMPKRRLAKTVEIWKPPSVRM